LGGGGEATHHLVALASMTNSNGIMGNNPLKWFGSLYYGVIQFLKKLVKFLLGVL
jgi:hypothetical protein